MDRNTKTALERQFGASLEMLENAIKHCPIEYWDTDKKFWYNAYHCLFWTDYYLTLNPTEFTPPSPFTLSEFDPSGALPDRTYHKEELLRYYTYCEAKWNKLIRNMDEEIADARWVNYNKDFSMVEIILYNMRHVQHHAAQLNLLLRQMINDAPRWVSITQKEKNN